MRGGSQRSGGFQTVKGRKYMRIRIGRDQRESIPLEACKTDEQAAARAALIADLANILLEAGRGDRVKDLGTQLGAATTERRIEGIFAAARLVAKTAARPTEEPTFFDLGEAWISGDLHRRFPDYVKAKRKTSMTRDRGILRTWIYPYVKRIPLKLFTLEHALEVMSHVPSDVSDASRRHIAQVMYRLMRLAVFPCRYVEVCPLPAGFLPKLGQPKATPFLYPKEDAKLLACKDIPLEQRVFYGLLAREGMRSSELGGGKDHGHIIAPLAWDDLDLEHGVLTLDKNKTGRARSWALSPAIVRALKRWRKICGHSKGSDPVVSVVMSHRADMFRDDLRLAKITRPELFASSDERKRVNVHSLRSTFVTLSLAAGRTETWVQDRTGHTSSVMINRYRRAARMAEELSLGELKPLDQAIPELRPGGQTPPRDPSKARTRANGGPTASKKPTDREETIQ